MRIGRVSSREAERATLLDRLDERVGRHVDDRVAAGLGQAAGSPRRAACGCGTSPSRRSISTSCSAARSSSATVVAGQRADDVEQQARRQRRPCPRAATSASSGTRRPTSMSVARSSTRRPRRSDLDAGQRLDGAAGRGDAGDGLQLRRAALRSRSTASRSNLIEWIEVIGAVEMWTDAGTGRRMRGSSRTRPVRAVESVRHAGRTAGRWLEQARGEAAHGLVGLGVGGDALRRRACAGVQDGGVVAPAEARRRWRGASRRCARARGTSRPGAARRRGRRGSARAARSRVRPKASRGRGPGCARR